MIQIPFTEYPAYSQDIAIEEVVYRFSFTWNTRSEAWYMSISDLDDNNIVTGIKLVLYYDLLATVKYKDVPQGYMFVLDETGNESRVGYGDFDSSGRNLQLIYMTKDEYESIQ